MRLHICDIPTGGCFVGKLMFLKSSIVEEVKSLWWEFWEIREVCVTNALSGFNWTASDNLRGAILANGKHKIL